MKRTSIKYEKIKYLKKLTKAICRSVVNIFAIGIKNDGIVSIKDGLACVRKGFINLKKIIFYKL